MSSALAAALRWLLAGIAPIPVRAGGKDALIRWRRFQTELPSAADVRAWWRRWPDASVAIVCGWRGLVVLDFDEFSAYLRWRANCDLQTREVRTVRGRHVYFFTDDPVSCDAPGWCELRGPGRYVLVPPSIHPSGARYEVSRAAPIAHVGSLAEVLPAGAIGARRESYKIPGLPGVPGALAEVKASASLLNTVGAIVRLRSSDGGQGRWWIGLCPFHDDHHPSLWIDVARGRWGCHKPECKAHRSGDVLDFAAMLRGVTVAVAARDLAAVR